VSRVIKEGDIIVLKNQERKHIVRVMGETKKIPGIGVYNTSQLIGERYGSAIRIGSKEYAILRPSIVDKIETLKREAQIILPKDSAVILMYSDIKSGDIVLESGIGSGAMTAALVNVVKPHGKVIVYENREDFANIGRENIQNVGFDEYVEIKLKDVTKGIEEKELDAVILDIPNPWDAVKNAYVCLKVCGHFASYSPTINQVELTVKELRKYSFIEIKTIELLEREIVVGERGTRPSFEMLGHTGYLTFARKIEK
jgi:tRNA (adenine57-N1/adenine58-N1)-methyltransferase